MKTLKLLFIISLVICLISCKSNENDHTTVIVDKTDTMQALKDCNGQTILRHLSISKNPYAGASVKITSITDLNFNKSYPFTMPEVDKWNSNEVDRGKEVVQFAKSIDSTLDIIKAQPIGRNGSNIFETLTNELNTLAKCKGYSSRSIILISDLLQNSKFLNCYDSVSLSSYLTTPDLFYTKMKSKFPLEPIVKGISLSIIYQPKSVKEDRIFYQISNLFKTYLESYGVVVTINTSF